MAAFAVPSVAGAAGNGFVSVTPVSANVLQGGSVGIGVIIDPPAAGTSVWIIRVTYDPSVVQYSGCTGMQDPGGGIAFAAGCDNVAPDAVTFGGWVQNDHGAARGFETPQTAGTFTFKAIGPPGSQTPLHVTVQTMLGPNGEVETPTTHDGVIHILAGAVGGTVEMMSAAPGRAALATPAIALAMFVFGAVSAFAWRRVRCGIIASTSAT